MRNCHACRAKCRTSSASARTAAKSSDGRSSSTSAVIRISATVGCACRSTSGRRSTPDSACGTATRPSGDLLDPEETTRLGRFLSPRRRLSAVASPACSRVSNLSRMNLELATAGESHGPALVAIVSGLPAGLTLDKAAIDADLRRRQEGYGRSPRQQIETDEVEVLAGLRHGRTLGTPLALVVRNRDHKNWTWGMSPWPPGRRAGGKGDEARHAAASGPRRPRRRPEVRARRRARRARARLRAAYRRVRRGRLRREGAAPRDRHRRARRGAARGGRRSGRSRRGAQGSGHARRSRRSPRDRRSAGARLVRAQGGSPRRALRRCRDGDPGREGRRDRRRLRARRPPRLGGARRDRLPTSAARRTAPAASRAGCRTARRSSSALR